jgi:hypothetical protein
MPNYATRSIAQVRDLATPRAPERHTDAYPHAAPAVTPGPASAPAGEPAADTDTSSLVRRYVLEHQHRTGQAPTTPHTGTLHTGVRR